MNFAAAGVAALAVIGVGRVGPASGQPVAAREGAARAIRGDGPRPRLAVVLSIDQFRADYLTRMSDLFLPAEESGKLGGFRYLMERGAYFANAHYEHLPLFTGPGHATILTGGHPYKTGIVGNEWWDERQHRVVYCVDDALPGDSDHPQPRPRWKVVGAAPESKAPPMGPGNLRSSTVGDELKLATNGRAKVVSLAIKDRAAILMGGHAQDACVWYDTAGGRWISSTAFCRGGELPAWAAAVNGEHIPDTMLGKEWAPSLTAEVLAARSFEPAYLGPDVPEGFRPKFPHIVAGKGRAAYHAFIFTPAANEFVLTTAERAVEAEGLGQDEIPDLLAINLSSNDYVGHAFGPYSPEMLDLTVQTDRQLAAFINQLDKSVPGGMKSVVFVLTADHGVAPISEDAAGPRFGMEAGRYKAADVMRTIAEGLTARFGQPAGGSWFAGSGVQRAGFLDGYLYLNAEAIAKLLAEGKCASRREIEQVACDALDAARLPGVYGCYGKTQILERRVPDNDLGAHLAKAIYPALSSDLIVLSEQMFLQDPDVHATSHATPYAYDTHVPVIICGPAWVRPGVYTQRAAPSGIAPTLSLLLGTELPSGCDGDPLLPALAP